MKATINDVADLAGVSIKTVSRVMNNEPSVRQTTREKVQLAVDSLQYQPNLAARSLASTSSYNIAYVYDNPNAYYIINMQAGILSACRQQGYELLIHPCDATQENITDDIIKMVNQSRIAGMVLTPPFSEMPHFVKRLLEQKISIVRIMSGDIAPDNLSPCVMVNDRFAAEIITQHLIDLGHKQIGFLAGGSAHKSTIERFEGYKKVLERNKISFNNELVVKGEYSFESGVDGAKKLLTGKLKPTAIFSCNDEIAAGALFSARLLGIAIPEQLAIVGFENSPFSRQTRPKLTTADQPNMEIAENATTLLINKIRNKDTNNIMSQFTPKLVIRESTEKTF